MAALILIFLAGAQKTVADVSPLQSFINSSSPGDTIVISAGTYNGNLVIDRRLVLAGVGHPVIRGDGTGSVITITADSTVVRGVIIEHSGRMLVNEDAGVLLRSGGNLIDKCSIRDVLFGVYLLHAEHNVILNNSITGRAELELGERGSGIHVWNSEHNTFTGNRITDVRDGFYIQNASHSLIERNEVFNVRYGVHYMYADSNTFLRNRFADNVAGAAIMYSKGIRMRHNIFSHNRGFSSFGILFQDCHGLVADSNVISDNVVGMFFEASTDNSFRHNIIAQNDVALQMFQNSTNNTFTGNNFIDNLSPLTVVGKTTGTRWNEDGHGNYWSQYDGYDLDGDGVGDVPIKIQNVFNYLEGRNANTRLYLYSPASQALAVATTTFPIMDIGSEIDEKPLFRPVDLQSIPAVVMKEAVNDKNERASHPAQRGWLALPFVGAVVAGLYYRHLSRRGVR